MKISPNNVAPRIPVPVINRSRSNIDAGINWSRPVLRIRHGSNIGRGHNVWIRAHRTDVDRSSHANPNYDPGVGLRNGRRS